MRASAMNELMLLRQLMGSESWLTVVTAVGLFLIVLYRRESIALPGLFRLGVIFFALAVAVPPFMTPLATYINGGNPMVRFNTGSNDSFILYMLMNAAGPVLLALSILCVFNAIMPRVFNQKPEATVPQRHPLDD